MAGNVVKLRRKPRPLRKSYSPQEPYVVERQDQDDGSITYEVMDERPGSYRIVCFVSDDMGGNAYAKHDADQIARALNMMVSMGREALPAVRETD